MSEQAKKMSGFYRFHAKIYQATRWTFLFGRWQVVERLQLKKSSNLHLLEIGCGTGHNLTRLAAHFPNMKLTGVDISPEMLAVAAARTKNLGERLRLVELAFGSELLPDGMPPPDLILISYCLTMINPGFEEVVRQAATQLPAGGKIAVVDFHGSRFGWFRRWMNFNHVRMEKHLLPVLQTQFEPVFEQVLPAYFGVWEFLVFVGLKKLDTDGTDWTQI